MKDNTGETFKVKPHTCILLSDSSLLILLKSRLRKAACLDEAFNAGSSNFLYRVL